MALPIMNDPDTILVVAAHPDDESLGCGGTIARYAAEGAVVHILFLAEGVTARNPSADQSTARVEIEAREAAARAAASVLGAAEPVFIRNPDNRLDTVPLIELAKAVEAEVAACSPSTVLTHHGGDLNIDHRRVHEAVLTACRPLPGYPIRAIYGFEVASSTEWAMSEALAPFRPQRFVDIENTLDQKLKALKCYSAELRPFPHPRSERAIRSLAHTRGSATGVGAAEGFTVLRELV